MTAVFKSRRKLTERQQNLLGFIGEFMGSNGFPPTLREIIQHTDFTSTSVVSYNIRKLVEKGFLEQERHTSRGIRLLTVPNDKNPLAMMNIPLLRRILSQPFANMPTTGMQQAIPVSWLEHVPLHEVYAVTVNSHLMYDAMVNTGDVIVLRRQPTAEDGDTVVVVIQPKGEVRIRRISYEEDKVCLEPLMPAICPQRLPSAHVQVAGKILGLLRKF